MYDTDQRLIQSCRQGDAQAWNTLVDKYERLVYSIALNYALSPHDAADISQITFTILLQSLDNLRADSRLGPWLATVARRHTWRLLERQRRESANPTEDLSDGLRQIADDASAAPFKRWERIEWLDSGLSLLNERCQALLQALYLDARQPSYDEVAAQLDMAVGSVGPTRARCLKRLKQLLLEQENG